MKETHIESIYYLRLDDFSFEEDEFEDEDFDSLLDEVFLPCEAEVPDLDEDDFLAGVLTVADLFESLPEETDCLLRCGDACGSALLLT
jgi:hypothetical protein